MAIRPVARTSLPAVAVSLESPIHVARDEDVQLAIIVVIEETRARTPAAGGDPGFLCDIGERTICVLMVEPVPELSIRLVRSLAIGHGVVNLCH